MSADGFIYFVTDGYAVKIGWSKNPSKRLGDMQVVHHRTLRIIGSLWGVKSSEALLHARFKHLHIRGEWFRWDAELHNFLEDMKAEGRFVDESESKVDAQMIRLRKRYRDDKKMLEVLGLNQARE
jgi:hypothetical protein